MKALRFIALTAMCMAGSYASAQDLIVKRDGTVIQAKVMKVGTSEVEYKKWSNQDGPQYSISVTDILAINYKNGEKETFENVTANGNTQSNWKDREEKQQGIIQVKPEDLSTEAKAANDALIAKYNAPVDMDLNIPEKQKKKIGKKAVTDASAIYGIKTNTIVSNEDIELNFILGTAHKKRPSGFRWLERKYGIDQTIMVNIRNKSSKTIYIDLGNTFYVCAGQSICYYAPSSTATTHGSQSGGSINLGAVAGALGIGGVAGTLANGVNVGGGSSNSNTNTTYSQRVIAVPPMASINLPPQYMFGNESMRRTETKVITKGLQVSASSYYGSFIGAYFPKDSAKGPMLFGDRYKYSEENSPLQVSNILAYSFEEDCSSLKSITSSLYLRELIGNYDTEEINIITEGILYNLFGIDSTKDSNVGEFPRY